MSRSIGADFSEEELRVLEEIRIAYSLPTIEAAAEELLRQRKRVLINSISARKRLRIVKGGRS